MARDSKGMVRRDGKGRERKDVWRADGGKGAEGLLRWLYVGAV